MKTIALMLVGIFCTALAWGFDATLFEAIPHPLQDTRLLAIQKSLSTHTLVRGQFQQNLKIPGLKPGQKTTGQFVYSQGQGIIWKVEKPTPLTLTISAQGVRQLQQDQTLKALDQHAKTFSPTFSEGFLTLFRGDFAALENRFDFSLFQEKAFWQLALRPRSKSVQKHLARMVLKGNDHLQGITLFSGNKYETQIEFSKVDLSQTPLTPEEAQLLNS